MSEILKQTDAGIDSLFLKALKIMQSNRHTASEELFEMYEEICRKRGEKGDSGDLGKVMKDMPIIKIIDLKNISDDKILLEKIKFGSVDQECDSRNTSDNSSNDEDEALINSTSKKRKLSSGSDTEISEAETNDNDDFSIDLDISSLSCVLCKTLSQINTNRLVECQECHNLYHQECHKPPITENVSDPRFVWYCTKCSKNMKKIASKVISKKVKTSTSPVCTGNYGPTGSSRNSPTPFTKAATIEMKQNAAALSSQQPFKRLDVPMKQGPPKDISSIKDSSTKLKHGSDQSKVSLKKPGKPINVEKQSLKDTNGNNIGSYTSAKQSESRGTTLQKPTLKNSATFSSAIGALGSNSLS